MIICHVCNTECEDGAELCPVCGADLTFAETEETANETVIEKPTLLATLDDVVSAEILKDMLIDAGIPYSSDSKEETMHITFGGSFAADDIYVDESDLEAANKVYEDFLNSESQFDEEFFDESENGEE